MDVKNLPSVVFVLVATGILIGIGVVIFGSFGNAVRTSNSPVFDEQVTLTTMIGYLKYNPVVSVGKIVNGTGPTGVALDISEYNVTLADGKIKTS